MENFDIILHENLKLFYENNKSYLNLNTPIDKWKTISDENICLFSSNKSIKGEIIFTIKYSKITKLGHFLFPTKMDTEKVCFYGKKPEMDKHGEYKFPSNKKGNLLFERLVELNEKITLDREKDRLQKTKEENLKIEREKEVFNEKQITKKKEYIGLLKELDVDGNGKVDIVEGDDYGKLLKINQSKIIEINRDYIKQFVQISNYLKTKRKSIQSVYEKLVTCINDGGVKSSLGDLEEYLPNNPLVVVKLLKERTGWDLKTTKDFVNNILNDKNFDGLYIQPLNEKQITEYIGILKDDGYVYNLILVNSIKMVQSLISDDMITFYEIYEKLDQLNMFDSKHDRDVKNLLGSINVGLDNIMNEIKELGTNIISSLEELNSTTEESVQLLKDGLDSVNSSIKINNLLTGIQTYQMYRINKNTKSLRG